jgi:hypothetical protein
MFTSTDPFVKYANSIVLGAHSISVLSDSMMPDVVHFRGLFRPSPRMWVLCLAIPITLLWSTPFLHVMSASLPNCVQTPGAMPVPYGMTSEEFSDQLKHAYVDPADIPPLCNPPPREGGYIISNPVAEQQVKGLNYTARDWSRWDSFDLLTDTLAKLTTFETFSGATFSQGSNLWGITNGRSGVTLQSTSVSDTPLSQTQGQSGLTITPSMYLRAYRAQLGDTFYPRGYATFRGENLDGSIDWIASFQSTKQIWMTDALMNVSYAANENYNIFRTAKRNTIRSQLTASGTSLTARQLEAQVSAQFDALQFDWLVDLPRNQATMDWWERFLDTIRAVQAPVKTTVVRSGSTTYDAFGLLMDGTGVYNQDASIFYSYQWAYLCGHYLKLMTTNGVRNARQSMYAQVAALYNLWQYRGGGLITDRLVSQGTLRVIGWSNTLYTILRAEAILKARNAWTTADAAYNSQTDWVNGRVTNADLIKQVDTFVTGIQTQWESFGFSESLSTYYVSTLTQQRTLEESCYMRKQTNFPSR